MKRKTGSELSRELGEIARKGFEKGLNGSNPFAEPISKMIAAAGKEKQK